MTSGKQEISSTGSHGANLLPGTPSVAKSLPQDTASHLLLGALASAATGSAKPLKLDMALSKAQGEVSVTLKLSSAEAGALKAKLADGSLPAKVTVTSGTDAGAVTLSGSAVAVKAVLAEIYFSPNPQFHKDFSIHIETVHDDRNVTHELKMHYDDHSDSYHPVTPTLHNGVTVTESIYKGAVASEASHQEISQVQVAELVGLLGQKLSTEVLDRTSLAQPPLDSSHGNISFSSQLNSPTAIATDNTITPSPASSPAPVTVPVVSIAPSAPLGIPGTPITASKPPVLTGIDPASYTENGVAFVLDNDVTLTDTDSPTMNGGRITVGYGSPSNSGDALSIKSDALAAGAIRLNGSNVEYSATGAAWSVVGVVTSNGSAGANLVIGLNAGATPAIAEKIIEHVTFTSTDDNPPASKTMTFTVDDGNGGISSVENLTVTMTAVNDAPTIANAIADTAASVSNAFSFTVPANSFSDPDNASLTYTATKSDNTALPAWISFNAATQTFTGTPTAPDLGTLSVKVTASDGALSVSDIFDIVVSNGLVASNLTRTETYTEDTNFNLTDIVAATAAANITATLTLSAAAAGAITTGTSGAVTSTYNAGTGVWSATGAKADVNALLASATFIPTLNYNSNFTIATHVDDTITNLNGTLTFNGTAVNDSPTVASAIPDQMTTNLAALNYTLPAAAVTFGDVEGNAVTYGNLEYWDGVSWTTTLPSGVTFNAGTLQLSIAGGAAVGGHMLRIAGTDNGTPAATGYAIILVGISGAALYGTPLADTLNGGGGNDIIIGLASNDIIYGFAGDDTIFGNDGNDQLYGGTTGANSGNDLIYGGAGSDLIYADYTTEPAGGTDTVYAGDGNDTIYGHLQDDRLYGENNDDLIYAGAGNDIVDGGAGNDNLYGEAGADTLTGGSGNDTFVLLAPNTDSTAANMDVITDFQQGLDLILPAGYTSLNAAQANAAASTATMLTWEQSAGNTFIYGSGGTFTLKLTGLLDLTTSNFTFATHVGTPGPDNIVGTSGVDVMYGYDGDDTMDAGGNDNIYYGGNGNDVLVSGTGGLGDTINGGAGNDLFVIKDPNHSRAGSSTGDIIQDFTRGQDKIYFANTAYAGISEGAWTFADGNSIRFTFDGTYTVLTSGTTFGGGGNNLRLRLLGNYTSTNPGNVLNGTDIVITNTTGAGLIQGNANAEEGINGSAGNDTIFANSGANDIWGDDGNDVVIGSANSPLNFASRGGDDTVFGSGSGDAFTYGMGGATNNLVNSGAGNDLLYNRGQDTLFAGSGNDNYFGNGWNALVFGEAGNDSMRGHNGVETLIGGDGNDSLDASGGNDSVWGGLNQDMVTLGGGSDTLWYTALTDSTAGTADQIADFVVGTDKIFMHPIMGATAYAQIDHTTTTVIATVTYTIVKFTVASGLDPTFQILLQGNLTGTLTAGDFIFGNRYTLNPAGENYTGTAGSITAGADAILGGIGNDTVNGNGGLDYIYGGAGDDTITGGPAAGDSWGDYVDGEAGNDSIQGGSSFDSLYGGDNDDTVKGGDGYDAIDGGLGNDSLYGENDFDTLSGGGGNDSLYGGNGFDSLDGGTGIDKLFGEAGYDFLIYDSSDVVDDASVDVSGGADIDRLEGLSGVIASTVLDGSDIIGIERFQTTGALTTMTFAATFDDGMGIDSIYGGIITVDNSLGSGVLTVNASALDTSVYLIGGSGNDVLTGSNVGDSLYGAAGHDNMTGGNGNDTITGAAGNDTITGSAGNDIFYYATISESTTAGFDRITDFTNGQDTFQLIGFEFYNKTFADLSISFAAGDTTILLNNTTFKIILTGDQTAVLDASDFVFG